jgi:predicted amidohydrolase
MRRLRLGMAQINTTVGDFTGNTRKTLKAIAEGSAFGVNLLTLP